MEYKLSIASNVLDNYPKDLTLNYEELEKLLTTFPDVITPKSHNKGFIAGHFNGKQRLTENLISRTLVTLDVDNYNSDLRALGALLMSDLGSQWFIAYSTASCALNKPKIRVVVLLDKEVPTESYRTVVLNFIEELKLKPFIDIDASSKPNQLMFLPAKSSSSYTPWTMINKGELLNPDYYIVDYGLNNLTTNNHDLTNIKPFKAKPISDKADSMLVAIKNRPLDITLEKIKSTLEAYKAQDTDYAAWLEVGMALHHQFAGAKDGAQLWYNWSKVDTRYNKDDIAKEVKAKWPSFSETDNPIKFSTIMKKLQDKKVTTFIQQPSNQLKVRHNVLRDKFLHTKGEKKVPMNTIENFKVIANEYKISIDYDVILKRHLVSFDGLIEEDLNKAQAILESLCIQNGMPHALVPKYMIAIERQVNTWRDFIESTPWDGIDRFDDICKTVEVEPEHEKIKCTYLRTWLMQMIHLTCLNDELNGKMGRTVLVFQSKQRGGKTSWFKALCPANQQRYLKEAVMLDTKSDMSILKCIQNVFVELGELGSTFKKSDSDSLKNFISDTTDMLNIKFLPHHKSFRRRTVFFGSVNDLTFLQDATGNTRYLCLPIIKCNYDHNVNMQQLYAQLLHLARAGEGYNIAEEYLLEQKTLNSTFENESYLQDKFVTMFDIEKESRVNKLTNAQILEKLGFMAGTVRQNHMTELSRILKTMGYYKECNSPRRWHLPPMRLGF